MQKKLIVLAIAAATSGVAFAQSNVTIYGNIDMGYMHRSGNNGGLSAVQSSKSQNDLQSVSSQSYIGFKGVEDLGNGLKALFDLQYVITPDMNSGIGTDYQTGAGLGRGHQYVGLTGGFGTAVAGQLDGIRYGLFGKYDPFGNGSVGNFASMTTQYDRASNAVAYISPSFSGFNVIVAHATNTQGREGGLCAAHAGLACEGNNGDDRLWSVNLNYANGPLNAALNYETTKAVNVSDSKLYVANVAASYDFGVVKVSGLYDIIKGQANSLIGGNVLGPVLQGALPGEEYDKRNWLIGATVPVNAKANVLASYGRVKNKTWDDANASKYALGVRYALSKRTTVYADYARIKNDNNAAYSISAMGNTDALPSAILPGTGSGTTGMDFGIKHSF